MIDKVLVVVVVMLGVLGACGGQAREADEPLLKPEDPDVSGVKRGEPQEGAPQDVAPVGPKVRGGTIARLRSARTGEPEESRPCGSCCRP